MYDLIGDIHGHADALEALLRALDYQPVGGVYRHHERRAIFLGDYIDRGPKIRQTLDIVRSMVEAGAALAVMGNHELNALAFHTSRPHEPEKPLRPHSEKNVRQHEQTILQLGPAELDSALAWFRTLPLWLELDGLRAVHACWDETSIEQVSAGLAAHQGVTSPFLYAACVEGGSLFRPVEILLKGQEIPLPGGICFQDKEGITRRKIRTRWYLPATGLSYGDYALQSSPVQCAQPLESSVVERAKSYPADEKPVFVGHYWLSSERPELLAGNVACLDFSVAKDGFLCAYRWQGEQQLTSNHFVWLR